MKYGRGTVEISRTEVFFDQKKSAAQSRGDQIFAVFRQTRYRKFFVENFSEFATNFHLFSKIEKSRRRWSKDKLDFSSIKIELTACSFVS